MENLIQERASLLTLQLGALPQDFRLGPKSLLAFHSFLEQDCLPDQRQEEGHEGDADDK
jgi:hypothetical protein